MSGANLMSRYVLARENNVLRLDFRREPDSPGPRFPGGAALRSDSRLNDAVEACAAASNAA